MCISGIIDNEGRSACPICKQKSNLLMIFQLAHSAGGYYITTTLLRFKTNFIKRLKK